MALGHVFSGRVWGRDVASVISRGGHQFTALVFENQQINSKRAPDESNRHSGDWTVAFLGAKAVVLAAARAALHAII